jgi:predicted DNA-binding transcriptional regulator YafY
VNEHEKIIYFSNNPYLKNSNLLGTIFTYIANKVAVHFTYRTFSDDTQKVIDFHPYLLKQYNNRWYVIGAADSDAKILTFALDRIIKVEPILDKIYRPCPEDLTERYEDIIGITYYEGEPVEEIVFWASDNVTGYIETKPIHGSQRDLKDERSSELYTKYPSLKGGKFYGINCIRNYELVRELCSYGPDVIVISPDHIQKAVHDRIQAMMEGYANLRT